MERKVSVIPQTLNRFTKAAINSNIKKRVAAYARVSTDSEEQLTSYETQVDYYTRYIQQKPEWRFVNVYTDEGISAVNTKHRDGFKQMIADAKAGKIDLIITKSVSRFARNTVDSISTIRELKAIGVEIYFEKENIYTLDSKGELFITIMSSLAQEESRSLSENVTWGKRRRFEKGAVSLPYKQFLGYERGEDGMPKIVEEQAALVRRIYKDFMSGMTPSGIARQLTAERIPTPAQKEKWQSSTVLSILTNEKYKGAALLQKKFTTDFLTKKMKVNEGEVERYYIEHSHEPIINPIEFEWVQVEIQRRKELGKKYSGKSIFSTKLICADCGEFYGAKVWQSNTKYRKTILQCNSKFKGDVKCDTPTLTEQDIKERFIKAYNRLAYNRDALLADCRLMQKVVSDYSDIDVKLNELYQENEVIAELTKRCIEENSLQAINQEEYLKRYNGYCERYDSIKNKIETLENEKNKRKAKEIEIGGFMYELTEYEETITEFDEQLWMMVIDKAIVHQDGRLVFVFRNGCEIEG